MLLLLLLLLPQPCSCLLLLSERVVPLPPRLHQSPHPPHSRQLLSLLSLLSLLLLNSHHRHEVEAVRRSSASPLAGCRTLSVMVPAAVVPNAAFPSQ